MKKFISSLLVLFCLLVAPAVAQPEEVGINALFERAIEAPNTFTDPLGEATLVGTFYHPGGETLNHYGFWDGGTTWLIRASFPSEGLWRYSLSLNDQSGKPLATLHDSVLVVPDQSTRFSRHGLPRVAASSRYLEHADGTPFFWLGDTDWEITWKSTLPQVEFLLSDRKEKGFTALQIVAMSHQRFQERGVENRNGEWMWMHPSRITPNPAYFRYLDTIVSMANDSGMMVVLVPIWSLMASVHPNEYHSRSYDLEEAVRLSRYMAARYAGHVVCWIVGGDNSYDTPEQKYYWSTVAGALDQAGERRQLKTVHPRGWTSSWEFFPSTTPWLDFHMYQSSHTGGGDYTWDAASEGYALSPTKPVLNGEPNYEDIYHNLWAPGDTNETDSYRISALHVRQAAYESILAGALVGITYGGNGVWQWHVPEIPATHSPRFYVEEAIKFPGSESMKILKDLLVSWDWYRFRPAPHLLIAEDAFEDITVADGPDGVYVYVPNRTTWFEIDASGLGDTVIITQVDPRTGDSVQVECQQVEQGRARVVVSDTLDWIYVLERTNQSSICEGANPPPPRLRQEARAVPNPSITGGVRIIGDIDDECRAKLRVYNSAGETVLAVEEVFNGGLDFQLPDLPAGAYRWRVIGCGETLEGGVVYQ